MKSVEVYDLQRSKWTEPKNLELPLGICYAEITPHPKGKKNSVLHHDLGGNRNVIFGLSSLFFSNLSVFITSWYLCSLRISVSYNVKLAINVNSWLLSSDSQMSGVPK